MSRVFVGTTNPAKLHQFRSALAPAGIEVLSVGDQIELPVVAEDQLDCLGNARKKARAFAAAADLPVMAVDAALFFSGLPKDVQPGVYVRRIGGRDGVTDDEVLSYYDALCRTHGGVVEATWNFGVAVAAPDGDCFETTIEVRRNLVSPPASVRRAGFPLDSLQVDPDTGSYLAELTVSDEEALWQRTIGGPLCAFVSQLPEQVAAYPDTPTNGGA